MSFRTTDRNASHLGICRTGPDRAALSLTEALLAILFLVVAYLPLSQLYHLTSQQTVQSRNQLVAQQLALNLFELYPMKRVTFLSGFSGSGTFQKADYLSDASARTLLTGDAKEILDTIQFSSMKMKAEIEPYAQGLRVDRVQTTIEWVEEGHARSASFFRLITP